MGQTTTEIQAEFHRRGAVLVPGVFSPAEVDALRNRIHEEFRELDRRAEGKFVRALSATMVLRIPEVLRAILHPRIIRTLQTILEQNFGIIPDFNLHRNMFDFTDTRRSLTHLFGLIGSGWHHDAGDEHASPYLFDPAYRMVKCGIYLQDNTIEWGGGVEIAPTGHIVPLRTGNCKIDYAAMRIRQNLKVITRAQRVQLKAGDFLAFHALLPHRGCNPKILQGRISEEEKRAGCVRLPHDRTKLVIYFNASRQACAHTYMRHSAKRGLRELAGILNGTGSEVFFSDFPGLRYPQDYPDAFAADLAANGLHMEQLTGHELVDAIETRRQALGSRNVVNHLDDSTSRPTAA